MQCDFSRLSVLLAVVVVVCVVEPAIYTKWTFLSLEHQTMFFHSERERESSKYDMNARTSKNVRIRGRGNMVSLIRTVSRLGLYVDGQHGRQYNSNQQSTNHHSGENRFRYTGRGR